LKPKKFSLVYETRLEIEIDPRVFKQALDPDWARQFYKFTEQEIAEFVGYNVVVNNCRLSQIDGFANLADDLIKVTKLVTEVTL
jgi:hypothetical protein